MIYFHFIIRRGAHWIGIWTLKEHFRKREFKFTRSRGQFAFARQLEPEQLEKFENVGQLFDVEPFAFNELWRGSRSGNKNQLAEFVSFWQKAFAQETPTTVSLFLVDTKNPAIPGFPVRF